MIAQSDYMLGKDEFKLICDVVYEHCGISLGDEKVALVRARVARQIRAGGFSSVGAYLQYALADRGSNAFAGFIDAISTNLTSFFREPQHFDFLMSTFLPALLEKKRKAGDGRVLAWSAACSSGEEPYSMAMTILDAVNRIDAGSLRWDLRLLATDISTAMLAQARAGVYLRSRLAAVPVGLRTRYFAPVPRVDGEEAMEAAPALRSLIRFRHLNLMDAWPFSGPFDFIFCRNVMIYFDQQTQQKLVERYWQCLRPGGLLFTGHSESLTGVAHRFAHWRASIYEKSPL
jgi:chemotaxis protein methyltransferase CheR